MKNNKVEEVVSTGVPVFRVRMQAAPPLKGFAVKYLSGMGGTPDLEPGYWLSRYFVDREGYINFNFEPDLFFAFEGEDGAKAASQRLKDSAAIEMQVVKIGL